MAKYAGKGTRIYANGWDMSAYLNNADTAQSADTHETTVFNSSDRKTYVPGNKDGTLSATGLFQGSAAEVNQDFNNNLGTTGGVVWSVWPTGSAVGNYGWGVDSIETGYNITTPVDGVVDVAIDAQSRVGIDRLVSIRTLTASSTNGNSASNDNTAGTTKGGVGYLQRSSTVARTATVTIEHSSSGSAWGTLLSFTATTNRTAERVEVSGTVKRYIREARTLTTGSTDAVTFNVGFRRK